ncbi:unnamed protein product [Medioppia subpectinata]|uniref:Uncharacterized protein n=1 Tax=Medioppia subpectinata TaxID=1979941 RepID=A0A7R9KVE3_9ACAR|nr:unnamed protein product [Medioppia subpectinata]CAG2110578.1 unnamed protein product [Medioppia subpectinata]
MNLGPPLHLSAPNMHSNPLSPPMPPNMSGWCHPTHTHNPYSAVNPYATHYMPALGRHFTHPSSATSLPPQADTPPQTPPALKLASMQLFGSESGGALAAHAAQAAVMGAQEQVNCVESAKLITLGIRGDQIGRNGNTSPPTHSSQNLFSDKYSTQEANSLQTLYNGFILGLRSAFCHKNHGMTCNGFRALDVTVTPLVRHWYLI